MNECESLFFITSMLQEGLLNNSAQVVITLRLHWMTSIHKYVYDRTCLPNMTFIFLSKHQQNLSEFLASEET